MTTPLVAQLLDISQLHIEKIQLLKDEIARLKGQKLQAGSRDDGGVDPY